LLSSEALGRANVARYAVAVCVDKVLRAVKDGFLLVLANSTGQKGGPGVGQRS